MTRSDAHAGIISGLAGLATFVGVILVSTLVLALVPPPVSSNAQSAVAAYMRDAVVSNTTVYEQVPVVESSLHRGNALVNDDRGTVRVAPEDTADTSALVRLSIAQPAEDLVVSTGASEASEADLLYARAGIDVSTTVLLPLTHGGISLWASAPAMVRVEVLATFTGDAALYSRDALEVTSDTFTPGSSIALESPVVRADTAEGIGGDALSENPTWIGLQGEGDVGVQLVRGVYVLIDVELPDAATVVLGDGQRLNLPAGRSITSTVVNPDEHGGVEAMLEGADEPGALRVTVSGWMTEGPQYGEAANVAGSFIPETEGIALVDHPVVADIPAEPVRMTSMDQAQFALVLVSASGNELPESSTLAWAPEEAGRSQGVVVDSAAGALPQLAIVPVDDEEGYVNIARGEASVSVRTLGAFLSDFSEGGHDELQELAVNYPADGDEIDLTQSPYFTIEGTASAGQFALQRVEVSSPTVDRNGDGDSLGTARIDYGRDGIGWNLDVSVPASGRYEFTIDAYSTDDTNRPFASNTVTVDVEISTDPDTPLIAPDVAIFNTDENNPELRVIDLQTVAFEERPNVSPRQSIVAWRSEQSPDGFMGQVTSINRVGDEWHVTTEEKDMLALIYRVDMDSNDAQYDPDELSIEQDGDATVEVYASDADGAPVEESVTIDAQDSGTENGALLQQEENVDVTIGADDFGIDTASTSVAGGDDLGLLCSSNGVDGSDEHGVPCEASDDDSDFRNAMLGSGRGMSVASGAVSAENTVSPGDGDFERLEYQLGSYGAPLVNLTSSLKLLAGGAYSTKGGFTPHVIINKGDYDKWNAGGDDKGSDEPFTLSKDVFEKDPKSVTNALGTGFGDFSKIDSNWKTKAFLGFYAEPTFSIKYYVKFELKIGIKWNWFVPVPTMEHFEMSSAAHKKINIPYGVMGSIESSKAAGVESKLGSVTLPVFFVQVGPLPVYYNHEVSFAAKIKLAAKATYTSKYTAEWISIDGFRLINGNYIKLDSSAERAKNSGPFGGGVTIRVSVTPGFEATYSGRFWSIIGADISGFIGVELAVTGQLNWVDGVTIGSLTLDVSAVASLGLDLVLGIKVFGFSFDIARIGWPIVDQKWLIYAAEILGRNNTLSFSGGDNGAVNTELDGSFTAERSQWSGAGGFYVAEDPKKPNRTLPPGIALAENGELSGTPTHSGAYVFDVRHGDPADPQSVDPKLTQWLFINGDPVMLADVPSTNVGASYSAQLVSDPGWSDLEGGLSVDVSGGTLVPGLVLDPQTGALTGAPSAPGRYTFTVTATQQYAGSTSQQYVIDVTAAPTGIAGDVPSTAVLGEPYVAELSVDGHETPTVWLGGGALPDGIVLTQEGSAVRLSGEPTETGVFEFVLQGSNASGEVLRPATILVGEEPAVLTDVLPDVHVGESFSSTIDIGGEPMPQASVAGVGGGAAPDWLEWYQSESGDVQLSGTPPDTGIYDIAVTLENELTRTEKGLQIVAGTEPMLQSESFDGAVLGELFGADVDASGFPAPQFSLTEGALPPGLALDPDTGALAGAPTAPGEYSFTVAAENALGADERGYSISVMSVPVLLGAETSTVARGEPAETSFTAEAYPSATFAIGDGSLPEGLVLDSESGQLSGTPENTGEYRFTVIASNAAGEDSLAVEMLVAEQPRFVESSLGLGHPGVAYSETIGVEAWPAAELAVVAGALPEGVSLSQNGALEGTPVDEGAYTFVVEASNAGGETRSTFNIVVGTAPSIIDEPLAAANLDQEYATILGATGYPAAEFTSVGEMPVGVALLSNGQLAGTPRELGIFEFTLSATNAFGAAEQTFTLEVNELPAFGASTLPFAVVGRAYDVPIGANGSPEPTVVLGESAVLPGGVQYDADAGRLVGVPAEAGEYTLPFVAESAAGAIEQSFMLLVYEKPTIEPAAMPPAVEGEPYSFTFEASGIPEPYFALDSPTSLPPGLELDAATGELRGTPELSGTYRIPIDSVNTVGSAHTDAELVVRGVGGVRDDDGVSGVDAVG